MLQFEILPTLPKKLQKIKKKNKKEFEIIKNKILEIANSTIKTIHHYKNLRKPKQHLKRVHINTHYVLLFQFIRRSNLIRFIDYVHHDKAYL